MILRTYRVQGTVWGAEHNLSNVLYLFAVCFYLSFHFTNQEISLKKKKTCLCFYSKYARVSVTSISDSKLLPASTTTQSSTTAHTHPPIGPCGEV